jgi:hypothetical protein
MSIYIYVLLFIEGGSKYSGSRKNAPLIEIVDILDIFY